MDKKQLANKLKELRKNKKLTQQDVAKKLGVTQAYYSSIENAAHNVSVEKLEEVYKALEYDIADFISNDETEIKSLLYNIEELLKEVSNKVDEVKKKLE